MEYGNIVKESVITEDTNAEVDEVWSVYTKNTVPNHGVRKKSDRKKEGFVRRRKK